VSINGRASPTSASWLDEFTSVLPLAYRQGGEHQRPDMTLVMLRLSSAGWHVGELRCQHRPPDHPFSGMFGRLTPAGGPFYRAD
jgi:hypothetical protein